MRAPTATRIPWWRQALRRLLVALGAPLLTVGVFLLLPLIESIAGQPAPDVTVRSAGIANVPPPPPPPEPEQQKEEDPDEKPPELAEETQPLDLSQLELALNPTFGDGAGEYAMKLDTVTQSRATETDALFSEADLDQRPRPVYQAGPVMTVDLRRKAPGSAQVIFIVDQEGRVQNPIAKASDPVFERPAVAAVKQWRFEPGKRGGKPVRFRMRVVVTFPKS